MNGAGRAARWPAYRTLWRWHFYAGLFCIPFVLLLALTGTIYLFKPQIDDLIDWRFEHLEVGGPPASPARQAQAALDAVPGSSLLAYELPRTPHSAVRIVVLNDGRAIRVYVDPRRLTVLKTVDEEDRFERIVFRLHGQLLLGNGGSIVVELAASWTIVMILTGLCLWWPREGGLRAAGLVYPRLRAGRRIFWRDLHATTGLWASAAILFLLISGLPWAYGWGNYLAEIRAVASALQARPAPKADWQIGQVPARVEIAGGMAGMPDMPMQAAAPPPAAAMAPTLAPLDRLVPAVRPLGLAYPVLLTPPRPGASVWRARSDSQDRLLRTSVTLDADGRVLSRRGFAQQPLIDRLVAVGVAAHEGHLFGGLNQLVNALVALALTLLTASALVLWLRRRPLGRLGAPPGPAMAPVATGIVLTILALAVLLPLLGTSMLLVLLVERAVLRRLPGVRDWLGLDPRDRLA